MTNIKLDEMRCAIASAQLVDLSKENLDEKRIRWIYNALFEAIEQVKILQDEEQTVSKEDEEAYWEASNEADETLIAHVNRRL